MQNFPRGKVVLLKSAKSRTKDLNANAEKGLPRLIKEILAYGKRSFMYNMRNYNRLCYKARSDLNNRDFVPGLLIPYSWKNLLSEKPGNPDPRTRTPRNRDYRSSCSRQTLRKKTQRSISLCSLQDRSDQQPPTRLFWRHSNIASPKLRPVAGLEKQYDRPVPRRIIQRSGVSPSRHQENLLSRSRFWLLWLVWSLRGQCHSTQASLQLGVHIERCYFPDP